ncbi:MAG: glycosyltransferase [Chloroflexota bacterium]|nr:glycosyltransferase [Chloroflexota bacterium]
MRFVSYYSRAVSDASGVTVALWAWANALAAAGEEVLVAHAGGPHRSPDPMLDVRGVPDVTVRHLGRRRPTYAPIGLPQVLRRGDVLLLHEGWVLSNYVAAAIAFVSRVPYVVVPHGVYEPGIMASLKGPRALRSRIERLLLEHALAVHVFWESERDRVTAVAPRARVIVAPIGAAPPAGGWVGGGGYVAWLGRFDPVHKGLDLLLEALARLEPEARPRLRMHGPDFNGGLAVTRAYVDRLRLDGWVTIGDPVYGEAKREFLLHADGYVHPSRWESYGIALVENLALGVPSVVSDTIHMATALRAADAAIVVPLTPEGVAEGLRALPPAADSLRVQGPAFVRDLLGWPAITARFLAAIRERLR